jgi:hypothetical protein
MELNRQKNWRKRVGISYVDINQMLVVIVADSILAVTLNNNFN